MFISASIILAILLDHWLGEPRRGHPLVGFGKVAERVELFLNNVSHSPAIQLFSGALATIALLTPAAITALFMSVFEQSDLVLGPLLLYLCIAANSLKQHGNNVLHQLQLNDMSNARLAVGYMVSRQTANMNKQQISRATIESILENGADAVFAPLFWFVIGGPAGVLFYRLTNTLDAMWGYKNTRFIYFGRAAARLDDVLNYIPARLTALSYALLGNTQNALCSWRLQANQLNSPNAGPVMTAGAGALNLQLGGPAIYHDQRVEKIYFGGTKTPGADDITKANSLVNRSLLLWVLVIIAGDFFA